MANNDVNSTAYLQNGPYPTVGIGTGTAVTTNTTLILTNYYAESLGGCKQGTTTNFLAQMLTITP